MAGKQTIDELISEKAFNEADKLTSKLGVLNTEFIESIKYAKQFSDTLAGAKALKDVNVNSAKAAQELEKLNRLMAQTATAQQNLTAATARAEQAASRLTAQQERQAASTAKTEAAARRASGAYEILNSAYRETTELARNAGAQFGENSTQFQNAARSANFLRERLDAIDRPLGNYQRNVGNYRSAFDGLGNSINQLTRELPAFAVSAQTGILALSNNIPIFFDQIQRTRLEVAALRAEGQATPSVLARLAMSFLSMQTVLSLGVTLVTIYGKEIGNFVKALFKGKEALDIFGERQKALNEVWKAGNADAAKQLTNLKYLYAAATDLSNAESDRLKAAQELQKEFPKTFAGQSKENIINGEASGLYKQLTIDIMATARAKAAAAKITTETAKILDAEIQKEKIRNANANENAATRLTAEKNLRGALEANNKQRGFGAVTEEQLQRSLKNGQKSLEALYSTNNKRAQESLKIQDDIIKRAQINVDVVEKLAGGKTKIGNALVTDDGKPKKEGGDSPEVQALKLRQAALKIVQETNKAIADNEQEGLDTRLNALDKYNIASKQLIDVDKQIKLSDADLTQTQIKTIETEAYGERLKQQSEFGVQQQDILKSEYDKQINAAREADKELARIRKETFEKSKQDAQDFGNTQLEKIQNDSEDALIALEEQYAKGKISKADYERQKLDIEYQANRDAIQAQLDTAKKLLDIQQAAGMDVSAQKKTLSELTRKLAKADADYEIAQLKTVKESRDEAYAKAKELAEEVFNFGTTLVNAGFENEKNKIQERSDAITEQTAKEIDAVNKSIGSEQEKADKVALINAKAKSQQDVLDARKREIAVRQAKFNKAISLAHIVQSTYEGAARALADYPFPFSSIIAGLVIAIGAAQAAQVIATPIPKYAKGTDYHKGGAMIVGDAGTELIIQPDGKQYLTPDTDTLTSAPKGTKVIPNHEVIKMLAKPDKINYVGGQAVDISSLVSEQRKTTKAIQQQKMASTLITKGGWKKQQQTISNWNLYRKNHFN